MPTCLWGPAFAEMIQFDHSQSLNDSPVAECSSRKREMPPQNKGQGTQRTDISSRPSAKRFPPRKKDPMQIVEELSSGSNSRKNQLVKKKGGEEAPPVFLALLVNGLFFHPASGRR